MKLLFNLECTQPSGTSKRHGGGRYGEVIFRRIVERGLEVSAFYNSSKWFNPELKEIINKYGIPLYDSQDLPLGQTIEKKGFTRLYLPVEVYDGTNRLTDCEVYGTIHGLRALELQYDSYMWLYASVSTRDRLIFLIKRYFPKWGYKHAYNYFFSALTDRDFHFIMVSNHSANAMRAYFPMETKNRTIPVYYSPSTSSTEELETKYPERYFLMVSGNRWEKNVLRGIIAFDRLFSAGYLKDTVVKITGVSSASAFRYKVQNPDKFQYLGYVDDAELEQLYHDAYAFVYPSLNEGFGYPPLEAMHYGVPVLTSAHTSISEICEGAALYFNPLSVEEIMARILTILNDEVHTKYSQLGRERYELITKKQSEDLDRLIDYIYKI